MSKSISEDMVQDDNTDPELLDENAELTLNGMRSSLSYLDVRT
jgi:hypothetical protein